MPAGLPASSNVDLSGMQMDGLAISSNIHDFENLDSEIPGLDSSARNDVFSETMGASSLVSTDIEDASQEQGTSLGTRSNQEVLPSISNDRSEELSPKAAATDSNSLISSTATSVCLHQPLVLPKMSAPVVNLVDEQKDQLHNLAFIRIIEAYKQIAVAGSSQFRLSLLASLGVEVLILYFQG
jgi:symplekin